ncbi:MAG: GDSL-type esterase/lipase family protein [Gammaproteobacteria bacterium]|nr:GDSL-type esterase/lipase family protein [Gammaproteobacteria bacterium]
MIRRPGLAAAAVGFGLLAGLALAEIGLFLAGADAPVLEVRDTRWVFADRSNRQEFREEEPDARALAATTTRILFLGDSVTFGQGIARREDRFTDLIESWLNRDGGGQIFHTYNAARSGSEPEHWLDFTRRLFPEYPPDLLVVVFFLRDGTTLCTSLRCHRKYIAALKKRFGYDHPWLRYSRLWRLYSGARVRNTFNADYRDYIRAAYLGSPQQTAEWRRQQEFLRKIIADARRRGIEPLVFIFPLLLDLENYPFDAVEREVERFFRSLHVPPIPLLPAFRGRATRDLWVSRDDQHPNEAGHRIAAEAMYPVLRERLQPARP